MRPSAVKRVLSSRLVAAGLIGAVAGGMAAYYGGTAPLNPAHARTGDAYANLDIFAETYELVRGRYVEGVEEDELVENAVNGMLTALDPHSSYLSPDAFTEMTEQTEGKFGGLGIEVTMEDGLVKVVAPIDDTPAARAGVQAGDLISHIDDEPVLGLTLSEAVDRMRGDIDTDIKLTILRETEEQPIDVVLTRDEITIYPVRARAEGDIGYLRVTTFNKQTADSVAEKLVTIRDEIGAENIKGYIIDLRNNPGGLLDQAIRVTDAFLNDGEIVSTRGREEGSADRFNASDGDISDGAPLVVLINGGSASASEIVAGALQDHRRAILVGTRSFGKGSVQSLMPLSNGGAVRLTTARYYTPSGRSIQALGIDPDIVVEQLVVEAPEEGRARRSEDSLRNRLDNDNGEAAVEGEEVELDAAEERARLRETDYQLSYALDLLQGVSALDRLAAD